MGSDGDFEFRRQELAHMTERQVDEITDEEVMQSYEDVVEKYKGCWDILLMEEILHQLMGSLPHYFEGFIHPRWCRISSINNTML